MTTYICNFDIELRQPIPKQRMTPNGRDIAVLRNANKVSVFWITETARRARLVDRLIKHGRIKLDACGYPWLNVTVEPGRW